MPKPSFTYHLQSKIRYFFTVSFFESRLFLLLKLGYGECPAIKRNLLYLPRLQADPGSPLLHQCTMRSTCTVVPSIPPFRFEEGVLCCQSSGQSNNKGNKQNRTIRNISCGLTTKEISRCPGTFKENCIVVT